MISSLRRHVALVGLVALALAGACGGKTSVEDGENGGSAGGGGSDGGAPAPTCGDGTCDAKGGEDCTSCALDCGLCPTCPNKVCDVDETCTSCPQDCGGCDTCGDGYCKGTETCLSCAPDCGTCETCGDGKCDAKTETCFTCAADCGVCEGCGDGICKNEDCASCPHDCGSCSVCGNGKCEDAAYESCSNCRQDCGDCQTLGCQAMFTCAIKCINFDSSPPGFSVACIGNCVSLGCADAQSFFDTAIQCVVEKAVGGDCGRDFSCYEKACGAEIGACIGARCPQPGE